MVVKLWLHHIMVGVVEAVQEQWAVMHLALSLVQVE